MIGIILAVIGAIFLFAPLMASIIYEIAKAIQEGEWGFIALSGMVICGAILIVIGVTII